MIINVFKDHDEFSYELQVDKNNQIWKV